MSSTVEHQWWSHSVGYQVYVRSFADSNADGIGDLGGVIDHLEHLAWLGVDLLWLTPFYPSPMADFGYDVADYTDVHPVFGSLADVDRLLDRAHRLGIRVIADLVPNHTSSSHSWFEQSRHDRSHPLRDYYLWRDPSAEGGPPNNWRSHFGGPAWTFDQRSEQYYCHLFLPEQPDLNWRNERVRLEFDEILKFWFERGLDGFRIDVAQALFKDAALRDNPQLRPLDGVVGAREQFECFEHRYDLMQPETLEVFRRWRAIARDHGAILIGETYVDTPEQLAELVPGDGLDVGFWFGTMRMAWEPNEIRRAVSRVADLLGERAGWVTSSHDDPRPATRFGGGELGRRRSLGFTTLLFGLPGVAFLYQGQELGLEDGVLRSEEVTDPVEVRNPGTQGRDGCRTPMPWGAGPNVGFSGAVSTWLPASHRVEESVAVQRDDPSSHLHLVRRLVALRRDLRLDPAHAVVWLDDVDPGVVAFRRGSCLLALNTADSPRSIHGLPAGRRLLFTTAGSHEPEDQPVGGLTQPFDADVLMLGPLEAVVVEVPVELGA